MAAFQIKDFASIVASMLNLMQSTQTKITDFNPGSINRVMLESSAAEMDELYQQMLNGLLQAIPVSVYNSFGFSALPSQAASGQMTVNITSQATNTPIVAGTIFTSATTGQTYTLVGITQIIAAGSTTLDMPVVATDEGADTNLGAATAFTLSPIPAGFVSAANPNAFINGSDAETPAQQLIRFNGYITTLQGATEGAIVYGAKTATVTDVNGNVIERVATAVIVEPYLTDNTQPISNIFCFIHNGVGSTSVALENKCQQIIDGYTAPNGTLVRGYKAAGVICTVGLATEQPINVTGVLTAKAGFTHSVLVTQAKSVISAYLLGVIAGGEAQFSLLETLVMLIPGVADFVISTPTANVNSTGANYKIMPGTLTIT